jgi:hypothetical protein
MAEKARMKLRRQVKPTLDARLWRLAPVLALFPLLLLALVSCMRVRDETLYLLGDEDIVLGDSATLVCSEQCRDSSQCGTIDSDWVILANSGGPATESHDLTLPDRAVVTIINEQMVTLQYTGDPAKRQPLKFYEVQAPDHGAGWVAGWCIGQPIVP